MKKEIYSILIIGFFALLIASCNEAPKIFCECLVASEKLNESANAVLQGALDETSKKKLIEARKTQKLKCQDFKETKGDKMREWKKSCAEKK